MGAFDNDTSIEGDVYVQRLATYIRRNEEALANGLLCFSKVRSSSNIKPLRPSFTTHHLYYITERIANSSLDVDVGPLNVKLDSPNHEPTFISFMANNARSQRHFESDARSISSINSMKSIVSSASVYWMSFSFSKDPRVIQKDVKYLYSSFTKIPCLILSPRTKINSVSGYEEYPCDTSVPLKMFKNLQVLELVEYEPNEVYGWHTLSEHLRILIVRNTKLASLAEVLYTLVADDEHGRSSFTMRRHIKKPESAHEAHEFPGNAAFVSRHRKRAMTATSVFPPRESTVIDPRPPASASASTDPVPLPPNKWFYMKQLTVTESSITSIPGYVFRPLGNLVKLNLSNNLLEDIPGGLEHLPHLKYLNLADNYITSLGKLPHTLTQLVTVNFNNNKLESLSGVESLSALEKIDLRRNKLKDLTSLLPLVKQVSHPDSKLNNIFVSNNNLQRTYRADLFNLFNAIKPKNMIKIDDSRPGYFERAMLLDPDSARRVYDKVMGGDKPLAAAEKKSDSIEFSNLPQSPKSPKPRKNPLNLQLAPKTPEKPKSGHKHSKSTGDVLESIASLNIQDLENTFANRKHASVMTTASSTSASTLQTGQAPPIESTPTSPSIRNFSKTFKPLLPNANLCNQAHYAPQKMPPMARQLSSPMIHSNHNGSSSTIKSSSTMTRLDIDSASLTNLAPNVITPVQVQVEGFH
ncbi:hypothetical protein OXX69_001988 [Metschnikowia pulcherrima]